MRKSSGWKVRADSALGVVHYYEERPFERGARVKTKHKRCWPLHPDPRFHKPRILYGVVAVPCQCRANPGRDIRGCRHDWVCIRWAIGTTPYGRSWENTRELELCAPGVVV